MATSNDLESTARLLHLFDAVNLGDGDINAGANVLATMAVTIANVQPPGAEVVGKEGFRTALGCSMVVSGALSSSLISDLVIARLQATQDSLSANVRDWKECEHQRMARLIRIGREVENDPENPPVSALAELSRDAIGESEHLARCGNLLIKPPQFGFHEIGRRPLVFGIAGSPHAFPRLAEAAHCGRLLAHVALNEAADCQLYQKVAGRLLNGSQVFQSEIRSVRGELIVTDPGNVLGHAVRGELAGASWLGRAVWLCDHAAGPDFTTKVPEAAPATISQVVGRFRHALRNSWAERLNVDHRKSVGAAYDVMGSQRGWVAFLGSHETSFPGITAALRSLPASLLFGLDRLEAARPLPADAATFDIGQVFAFARVLARRMINGRGVMLHDGRRVRIEALADTISRKLLDGPLTVREITRRSHRLPASDCEETLEFLMTRGRVTRTGNVWALIQTVASLPSTPALTVDV
jgi:hypothetical protein